MIDWIKLNTRYSKRLTVDLIALIILISISFSSVAQSLDDSISTSGEVRLDAGVALTDYAVDITVQNHSIVILLFPSFSILRPLLSSAQQRVIIDSGTNSAAYSLDGISTEAVNYRLEFECVDCGSVFPSQFFTLNGNAFRASNEVYIDPADFPQQLDFELESGTSITGRIISEDARSAYKDLFYRLSLSSAQRPNVTMANRFVTIDQGSSETAYQFDGLRRTNDGRDFILSLDCILCRTRGPHAETFQQIVPSNMDTIGVDFRVPLEKAISLPYLLDLITE